ncbi:uncharacterized protein ARMOST_15517 [Armillaria ostoyae]|uniref:Uncharacterized protein n=1 Tax=Armillaria ostoyae TaxID=47428 RepID=A0A284RTL5_ARMOS|nr:uncharacterized protein ARMOST_15517 [Armillaria ostoyae]
MLPVDHNGGGEVVVNEATLLQETWSKKVRHQDGEWAPDDHTIGRRNRPHRHDPSLKEWEMHEFESWGGQRQGLWRSDSLNCGCIQWTLSSSIDGMSHELITVIMGCWCPNVPPTLLLIPSSLSTALQQLLLPLHALPYILPWPSNRAWCALPLAIIAVIDTFVVLIIIYLQEFGSPTPRWWSI